MKLGLFGGTFNPIHNGHIKVICHVKQKFGLNEIHVIPSALPPHKPVINLAASDDRRNMVKCSIKNIEGLVASDIEIKRKGPSFTIDTINQLQKNLSCHRHRIHSINADIYNNMNKNKGGRTYKDSKTIYLKKHKTEPFDVPDDNADRMLIHSAGDKTELYLIMGSDAFFDIPTWKKNIEIFSRVPVIVMTRAGEKRNLNHLARLIKDMISDKYYYDINSKSFLNSDLKTIYIHNAPDIAISSTLIRKHVQNHLSISSMVQPCVEKIIKEKGLYL